jgi:HTH-type transcriptional regulator/antitoxin HigA
MNTKSSTSGSSARTGNTTRSTRKRSESKHSTARPRVLKTRSDYESALVRAEALMDARAGTSRGEELELWACLIELYEKEHYPIDPPNPIDAILFRMEQQGLDAKDLVPILGSRSRVSEILSGKRSLSLRMIRALNTRLGISAEILVRPNAA